MSSTCVISVKLFNGDVVVLNVLIDDKCPMLGLKSGQTEC